MVADPRLRKQIPRVRAVRFDLAADTLNKRPHVVGSLGCPVCAGTMSVEAAPSASEYRVLRISGLACKRSVTIAWAEGGGGSAGSASATGVGCWAVDARLSGIGALTTRR